jgi:hypothetical protein
MPPKKSKDEGDDVLQAVIIADSFKKRFRPLSYEKPKALMPMVGIPLLDYAMELLMSSDVKEIFVFCCSHADSIDAYIKLSTLTRFNALGRSLHGPRAQRFLSSLAANAALLETPFERSIADLSFGMISCLWMEMSLAT